MSAIIVACYRFNAALFLPALERVHELSRRFQAAAHHDRLLSHDG